MSPRRIQRRRIKGWKMPEGAVYVGRPGGWGNPYPWRSLGRKEAARRYRESMLHPTEDWAWRFWNLHKLHGKDLVCWCPLDKPCHADVLLELADSYRYWIAAVEARVQAGTDWYAIFRPAGRRTGK